MKKQKIIIIVPEYNEGDLAVNTVNKILKVSKNMVVIVDDGSKKESYQIVKKAFANNKRVYLLRHVINMGKGATMKTGVKMAWKLGRPQ
jgi:glycosyltransferase involved in cell wall biosynthesis